MTAPPVLAVVGFDREAALVAGPGVVVVAGGGDREGLRAKLAEAKSRSGLRAVVSVGIGGGLVPVVKVGDWVVAERIIGDASVWPTHPGLVRTLSGCLEAQAAGGATVHLGPITAGDTIITEVAGKAALHARTGALAVDMESHIAARFAAEHALPFAALRVISDGAQDTLPPAVLVSMTPDGGLDGRAILASILRRPAQIPALVGTGRRTALAFRRLRLLGRDHLLGRLGIGDADFGELALDVV